MSALFFCAAIAHSGDTTGAGVNGSGGWIGISVMGLVLVEGIPGSGKSSTSQWLAGRLGGRWWYESLPVEVRFDRAGLSLTGRPLLLTPPLAARLDRDGPAT